MILLLQNAVGDVTYVEQISDQDIARGNPPLIYKGYMLSASATYNNKFTVPGKKKRAVYLTAISVDDGNIPVADTLDGEYEIFTVDTDVSDLMVNATNSNHFGNWRATNTGKPKSNFHLWEEWNKLTQEKKYLLIAKLREEQMGISHQDIIHEVDDFVNLDDIVAYTSMNHDVTQPDDNEIKEDMPIDNALLAYMAGRGSDTSPGNIWQVLASNNAPNKNKSRKASESHSAPCTFQFGDMAYYLHKDETLNFQGQNYLAHLASIPYRVSHHDVAFMEKSLIDRGANGGICGDDMTVLEKKSLFVWFIWTCRS
jgi:hypothetical protein